jgi:ribosomal protein L11 methyltransferase
VAFEPDTTEGLLALIAYFPDETTDKEVRSALDPLCSSGRIKGVSIEGVAVPEVDWVARFREGFRAFRAGSFDVAPVWDVPAGRAPSDPTLLIVDPGRAFGTGTHETTRLCLEAIEAEGTRRPMGRVLDVGTGTGLLAVAAAKRGARIVAGVDNDPEATAVARRHAALNEVTLHVVQGDGGAPFQSAAFDLVLANLMAPLLIERRRELAGLLAKGGALVVSGLLETDVDEVQAAYEACGAPSVRTDGEWAALHFRAPSR